MKYRFLGLALVLGLGRAPLTMAATPCFDLQDMACRDQFIEDNLPPHPHKPNEKDLQDPKIQALDKDLDSLLKEIKDLRIEETKAGSYVMQARERNDSEDLAKSAKVQLAVQKTLYDDCNRAIADAKTLYHLTPKIVDPISHGDSDVPAPTKAWLPHYGEFDLQGNRLDENSDMVAGTNIMTANLTLFPGSFVSREQLAASIYHETVHWLNDNALGREPTPYEDYKNEVLAYDNEMTAGPDMGLSDGQVQTLKSHQGRYLEYLKHVGPTETWQHLRIDHPNYSQSGSIGAPPEPDPREIGNPEKMKTDGDDSFWAGVQDAAALERAARERNEANRALEQADLTEQVRRAKKDAQDAEYAANHAVYHYLKSEISLACTNPDQFQSEDEQGHLHPASIEHYHLAIMSQDDKNDGCVSDVLDRILQSDGPVSSELILSWAFAYGQAHTPFIQPPDNDDSDNDTQRSSNVPPNNNGSSNGYSTRHFNPPANNNQQWKESGERQVREQQQIANKVHEVFAASKANSFDGNKHSQVVPHN